MKLNKLIVVNGVMTAVEGIHIGGTNDGTQIGGCDNPVIRNPITGDPYIPGTSVKGVMRSGLEKKNFDKKKYDTMVAEANRATSEGERKRLMNKANDYASKPCGCGSKTCMICTMFGAHMNTKANSGEPRLIIRDMQMNEEFKEYLKEHGINMRATVETRTATMIDRSTNTAAGTSLRNFERVTAGVKFDCEFVIKVFEGDNEDKLMDTLKEAIEYVGQIGLGAKHTSGNGKVSFDINWDKVKVINM